MSEAAVIAFYGEPVLGLVEAFSAKFHGNVRITKAGYGASDDEIRKTFADAAVIVTNRFHKGLPLPSSLKLIQLPGAGHDEVDLYAVPNGVAVCNVYEHEVAVAEFVLMSMLDFQNRHLAVAETGFRNGSWAGSGRFNGPKGAELFGKTLGVVGLGRIGKAVSNLAHAFGMTVLAANRTLPDPTPNCVTKVFRTGELADMLPACHFVVISCALNDATEGLFGSEEFGWLRHDAYLINISRGPLIQEAALHAALKAGALGGAHIDVWYRYPDTLKRAFQPSQFDFSGFTNLRMTPHIAGWTDGTVARRLGVIAANIEAALSGGTFQNRLDQSG